MANRTENVGIFTAYGFAREGGYVGTKAEFEEGLAKSANYATNAQASATAAANSATSASTMATAAASSAGAAAGSANTAAGYAQDADEFAQAAAASADEAEGYAESLDPDTIARIDGYYDLLTAGYADNLTPYSDSAGASQNTPFILQGSGCANGEEQADTGSYCQLKEKRGNTVVVNQLAKELNSTNWFTVGASVSYSNNIATIVASSQNDRLVQSISTIAGHNYLVCAFVKLTTGSTDVSVVFTDGSIFRSVATKNTTGWQIVSRIADIPSTGGSNGNVQIRDNRSSDWDAIQVKNVIVIDLTLWFGSNDKIPTHLLNHPEDFFRYYQGSLAYNAGTLTDSNGRYLKTTGRQVWDEQWEVGRFDVITGENVNSGTCIRSKNYIPVVGGCSYYFKIIAGTGMWVMLFDADKKVISERISGASYTDNVFSGNNNYFTLPNNCAYMRFYCPVNYGTTYNHDITISLYYEGESGYDQYYPYEELANIDTGNEELLAFDWKEPNGTIHHDTLPKIDMGTLSFVQASTGTHSFFCIVNKPSANKNVLCSKYPVNQTNYGSTSGMDIIEASYDKEMFVASGSSRIFIVDSAFIGYTGEQVAAALSGVMLEVEADDARKTTEQGTPFPENVAIDDFGSMAFDCQNGVPQGNLIFYPVDYKAEIDTLHNITEGDMHKIALKGNLADGEPETIEEVVDYINARIPAPPAEDGTYNLTVTVASGESTYSWVSAT